MGKKKRKKVSSKSKEAGVSGMGGLGSGGGNRTSSKLGWGRMPANESTSE